MTQNVKPVPVETILRISDQKSFFRFLRDVLGDYTVVQAAKDHAAALENQGIEYFKELSYYERKALHNLKYFTWVEQQGKTVDELNAQWDDEYWQRMFEDEVNVFDGMIEEFNALVGTTN